MTNAQKQTLILALSTRPRTTQQIADAFGVNRVTVIRWLHELEESLTDDGGDLTLVRYGADRDAPWGLLA